MIRLSLGFVLLMSMVACGDDATPGTIDATPGTIDATPGTIDAAPSTIDAQVAADAGPPATNCVHEIVATGPMCNADCDARLTTPNNMRWCTSTCIADGDCIAYSPTLTCSTEVGTCMPRCMDDATCQAIGLPRCHPVGNFCDTLPACSTDAQCQGVGYDTCVMPGNYCE